MSFLPQDYEAPKAASFYLKLQDGENRIRILSKPVIGWEDWDNKKPIRYKFDAKPAKSVDPKKPVRHFWAFIVYNYTQEQIQIMHVTQASIRNRIQDLCNDVDWGSPYSYDIKIVKTGELVNTKYSVNPVPHKPLDPAIIEAFDRRPCLLEALFFNGDVFSPDWKEYTPRVEDTQPIVSFEENGVVAMEDLADLKKMFEECDTTYQKQLLKTLKNLPSPVNSIEGVPPALFDRIRTAVQKKRDEYQMSLNAELVAV